MVRILKESKKSDIDSLFRTIRLDTANLGTLVQDVIEGYSKINSRKFNGYIDKVIDDLNDLREFINKNSEDIYLHDQYGRIEFSNNSRAVYDKLSDALSKFGIADSSYIDPRKSVVNNTRFYPNADIATASDTNVDIFGYRFLDDCPFGNECIGKYNVFVSGDNEDELDEVFKIVSDVVGKYSDWEVGLE